MLHFFQRRSDPAFSELDYVKRVLRCLKSSRAQTRLAVGAGVYLANADFVRRFAGMKYFREIPSGEQGQFYAALSELEVSLRNREAGMALGVGLYRIWLADMLAGRKRAAELLGEELTELSRRASCVGPWAGFG